MLFLFPVGAALAVLGAIAMVYSTFLARRESRHSRRGFSTTGDIVGIEREYRTVTRSEEPEAGWRVEDSFPVVAFQTPDGREWRERTRVGRSRSLDPGCPKQLLDFRWTAVGRSITEARWTVAGPVPWRVGQAVPVRYLPQDPSQFRIADDPFARRAGNLAMLAGALLVTTGMGLVTAAIWS